MLNMPRTDQDLYPGPTLIDPHNVKIPKQPSSIIVAQNPQNLDSSSQPNTVKIPHNFHLFLQSIYGSQDKIAIKKSAAGQPYHRPTNISCTSTGRAKE